MVGSEVKKLHARIMEVGGSRVQQQQSQLAAVGKELDATSAAITKAKVAIKSAERNCKKCQEKVASLEREVEETEARIKEVKVSEEGGHEWYIYIWLQLSIYCFSSSPQGVLSSLEEEAKGIIAKQEEIHVRSDVVCEVSALVTGLCLLLWAWQAAMLERESLLEELKKQLEEMGRVEQQQQTKRMDLMHEMEKYAAKMKENSSKIRHFTAEVSVSSSLC